MRALFLQVTDRLNARDKWLVGVAARWMLVILAFILYSLILARVAFAKAERNFEAWQVEYAAGYVAHMQTVEENMPQAVDPEQQIRVEMMQEYWRRHK